MTANEFFNLERRLIDGGYDSDLDSFAAIKERLRNKIPFSADEFARQAVYVVLAGGFSQKTAKRVHAEIMRALNGQLTIDNEQLLKIFNNKNKINAIVKIWENRNKFRGDYYKLSDLESKLTYLATLPHIGKITANHLARNLGENVFKRDVWIEKLLSRYGGDLLERLEKETALPRGYIDVVLWKACQIGMIKVTSDK
jgi:hypothetical protein